MTIDPKVRLVHAFNLFQANKVLNIVNTEALNRSVSAISFVAPRSDLSTPWSAVLYEAIQVAINYLVNSSFSSYDWYFFGANELWRIPSTIALHKKFWKATPNLDLRSTLRCSPEVAFQSSFGVRHAVCAQISPLAMPAFGEWIRSTQSGLIFVRNPESELDESLVKRLFNAVFDKKDSSVDWRKAILNLCDQEIVLLRFSGGFDDPDAAVDIIYDPSFHDIRQKSGG